MSLWILYTLIIVILVSIAVIIGFRGHWLGYRQAIDDIRFEAWMKGDRNNE